MATVLELKHGRVMDYAPLDCGHSVNVGPWQAVKTVTVGEEIACEWCASYAADLATLRAALAAGIVSHSRAGDRLARGSVHVYQYEPKSPTGVILLVTLTETPEVIALLRGGLSPLSPTEPR